MTAVCGGGASQARPEFAPVVFVGPAMIGALLNNIPTPWAVGLAAYVGLLTYDLAEFCTVDPPPDPGLTAGDALAILTLQPIAAPIAEARFRQFLGRYFWYDLCKCTAGATPAAPAAPARPVDWPDVNPPAGPQPRTVPVACHDQVTGLQAANGHFAYAGWLWNGNPATLQSFKVTIKQPTTGPAHGVPIQWKLLQTGQYAIGIYEERNLPLLFDQVVEFPVVPPARELRIEGTCTYDQADWGSIEIQGFCGDLAAPPPNMLQCCPPDPALLGQVHQVLELVTLMQRQLAPFAYIASTSHAGLTGHGSFDIQGLLGVKVAFTTLPPYLGRLGGSPDEIFELGFITFGTADGYPQSIRLEHNPQIALPARCSAFTTLGYTLPPGVVATITELVREP